jgi:hypothetical protein
LVTTVRDSEVTSLNSKQIMAKLRAAAHAGDETSRDALQNIIREGRESREAAEAFVRVCKIGDPDDLMTAVVLLNGTVDGWGKALRQVARLKRVRPEIQQAFLTVWVESKMLSFRSRAPRLTMLKALRVLVPRTRCTVPVRLFRGASASEYERRAYGFSWSTERAAAERFAQDYRRWDGGSVLFETIAPQKAVLHVRERTEAHFDEGEYIIDPQLLARVKLITRYEHASGRRPR